MPCFLVPLHEFNPCHNPEGTAGGQFCSTRGSNPGLLNVPRPRGSKDLPDFLKADVLAARRAGIMVQHTQQPEPVQDVTGQLHDPLALSHARRGEETYWDEKGWKHVAPRGRIRISTRGGEFDPMETVYDSSFSSRRREKTLTPEMLPEAEKATVEDIVSTFRHEVGHILDDKTWPGQGSGKIGQSLAREIRAWQYAVEATPDHRVSQRMVRNGLTSHAYSEFRKQAMLEDPTTPWFKRQGFTDREENLERAVQEEIRRGIINIEAHRKAEAFATRVQKSLTRYGDVLRKKGFVRVPTARTPWRPKPTILPGPGGRGWI